MPMEMEIFQHLNNLVLSYEIKFTKIPMGAELGMGKREK
jgi:hypothetical protein